MKAESVGMMPIYTGVKGEEKQGLATGSENYWCINDKASDADKKATEDFLSWVITSDTGKKAISQDMGFTTPFKTFDDVKFDNPLTEAAVEDQKSGKTQVSWNFTMMPSEEWKNKVGQALLEYAPGHRQVGCRQDRLRGRLGFRIRGFALSLIESHSR